MNDMQEELFERYTHGLKEFVAGGGEPALMAAYDLGRRALAAGLGVLEMAALHHRALVSVSAYASTPEEGTRTVKAAEQFFIESLSPFEIALRGYRESNTTLRRVHEILEQQTKRIAHALHDEAEQLLAPVHLALGEITREVPPQTRKRLIDVGRLLKQIREQLRRLSHELHPTILDDLGLIPAIEFLAEGVSKRTALPVVVEGSFERPLPAAIATALYRIVQECLTNVTRHAQASSVKIHFRDMVDGIRCIIRDDGIGFNVSVVLTERRSSGLGLPGIRERLNALGGAFQIDSAPGRGTEVRITIPFGNTS